jgi:hypothetical protein
MAFYEKAIVVPGYCSVVNAVRACQSEQPSPIAMRLQKDGHPVSWLKGRSGCGGVEVIGVLPLDSLHSLGVRMTTKT